MNALAVKVDAAAAIEDAAQKTTLDQLPLSAGRMLDLEAEPRVGADTRVKRRAEITCTMTSDAERVHLHFSGRIVSLPASLQLSYVTWSNQTDPPQGRCLGLSTSAGE